MSENMTQKELDFKRVINIFYNAFEVLNNVENQKLIRDLNRKYSTNYFEPVNERILEDVMIDLLRLYEHLLPEEDKDAIPSRNAFFKES